VDDEARVAHLKELEAEMTASPDRKLVIEFKLVAKTFKVFVGNDRQLQRYLAEHSEPATALKLWNLDNRAGFYDFLDEVGRLFHNYLAGVGSLRDHTRALWGRHLPDDPAYDEQASETFAESGSCVFVQKLRNYTLHNQLPVAHGHLSGTPGEEFKSAVRLSRPDLLRWSGWPVIAREYLASLPEDTFELTGVVADYSQTVAEFNEWFGAAFVERTQDAFDRLRELESAYRAALTGLDRSRAQAT